MSISSLNRMLWFLLSSRDAMYTLQMMSTSRCRFDSSLILYSFFRHWTMISAAWL